MSPPTTQYSVSFILNKEKVKPKFVLGKMGQLAVWRVINMQCCRPTVDMVDYQQI